MDGLSRPRRRASMLAGSAGIGVAVCLSILAYVAAVPVAADALPARLSDQEFWKMVSDMSEPNGFFRSDNLLSNETAFQYVIPELLRTTRAGRIYMGVGPEQNFTYIAAMKPAMAFIVDVRRGNLDLQLAYKALFELSADRVEFVSRLFSKKRPDGLTPASRVEDIFASYAGVETSQDLYAANLKAIDELLTVKHGFGLSADDLEGIEYAYHAFSRFGPEIQYSSTRNFGSSMQPTFAELMTATDERGVSRSFLASEENYAVLRDLETKNLLVPVVGNFAGPKAIRAVGQYLKEKGAVVSAFYLSNVEMYLRIDGIWNNFCGNVAALPLDATSTFIRSVRNFGRVRTMGLASELGAMASEVEACH